MIANKIKPKIQKVIDKFPTYVDIYRDFLAILHHSLSGNLRSYLHYDSFPGNSAN